MLQVELSATVRNTFGKGAMRCLRSDGKTPAILYGLEAEPMALQLETKEFYKELLNLRRRNAVVALSLDDGKTHHVLIKDVQTDPVRDTVVHADFQRVDLKKSKQFGVDVKLIGNPKGVDLGGVIFVEERLVILEGLPLDIPDNCPLDISELDIGDSLSFDSLDLPKDIRLISDKDQVCVKVENASKVEEDDELQEETVQEDSETETTAEGE